MRVGKAKRLRRRARLERQRTAWEHRRLELLGVDLPRLQTYDRAFILMGDGSPPIEVTNLVEPR